MAELINALWLLVVAGGPLLLAILFAWALLTRRRKGPAERREQDRATREAYRDSRWPASDANKQWGRRYFHSGS